MGSFNRDGVKRRLVEIFTHVLGDQWSVCYAWPGDDVDSDHLLIFGPALDGDASVDTTKGAPGLKRLTTDSFSIIAGIQSYGHDDPVEAERFAADAVRKVHDWLRSSTRLRDADPAGIPNADPDDWAGISSARLTTIEGPYTTRPTGEDDIGLYVAECLLTITCTSQL